MDVPPSADLNKVYAALEMGAAIGIWDFEEGHVGHELGEQRASSRSWAQRSYWERQSVAGDKSWTKRG